MNKAKFYLKKAEEVSKKISELKEQYQEYLNMWAKQECPYKIGDLFKLPARSKNKLPHFMTHYCNKETEFLVYSIHAYENTDQTQDNFGDKYWFIVIRDRDTNEMYTIYNHQLDINGELK